MKYLFVGDIHNHSYIFKDIYKLDKEYNFDKIIFLGDYVDDWNSTGHQSLETLNTIIAMKNSFQDKIILLIGNHELSYIGAPCSGHNYIFETAIENKIKENINLFNIYTEILLGNKTYICSHAGINNDYIINTLNNNWKEELNIIDKNILSNIDKLSICSSLRGGSYNYSSILWCDKKEHEYFNKIENPIIPYQIIGHTPVSNIDLNKDFIFIDTHSTYRDGSSFGDKSYLIWNESKFEIIKSIK